MPWKPPTHGTKQRQAQRKAAQRDYDQKRGSPTSRGYQTPAWEWLRRQVFLRDLWTCQTCGNSVEGKGEAHCDHIVAKEKGGKDEMGNLQTLCARCHSRKTAVEDGGFGR